VFSTTGQKRANGKPGAEQNWHEKVNVGHPRKKIKGVEKK